jgi:ATP-binding cassette subfamily B protein
MAEEKTNRTYRKRNAGPTDIRGAVRFLLGSLSEYRGSMILVVVCIILEAGAGIASSYFFKPIIEDYVLPFVGKSSVDLRPFVEMLAFMAGVYLAGTLAAYVKQTTMSRVSTGLLANMRNSLFDHAQDLPMTFFDSRTHGEIMTYFTSDVDTLRQLVAQTFPQAVNTILQVVGITVVMFLLSPTLALIAMVNLALVVFNVYFLGSHGRHYFIRLQQCVANLMGYAEEIFTGQKVVKAFQHEKYTKQEYSDLARELYDSDIKTGSYGNIMMPVNANLSFIGYAVTAAVGATMCIRGKISLGTVASFLMYVRQIGGPISRVSQEFNYVMMALAGAERVNNLLNSPAEPDDGRIVMVDAEIAEDGTLTEADHRTGVWAWKDPDNGNALTRVMGDVRFKDVDFSYVPGKQVLKGISFYAKPGQKIAFVGSTGAGKTTITNLITRFYDIQSGSITYDGFDIKSIAKESLRRSIGMVLQSTNLFSGTVMENIRYGRLDATDEECVAAAKLANADSFITRLPHGYQTMLTANGANLSQGQRQLLNIARAAVASPPVLVLDEATSSIDPRTEALVQKAMDALMKGRTTFVIAHRLSTIRNAERILVLTEKGIEETGTHQELMEKNGIYAQLYQWAK